jgi:folate-dependent phosphoribosylglycinamide formyltransferase PurN
MKNIVIFASGTGSNAENIIRFFSKITTPKEWSLCFQTIQMPKFWKS